MDRDKPCRANPGKGRAASTGNARPCHLHMHAVRTLGEARGNAGWGRPTWAACGTPDRWNTRGSQQRCKQLRADIATPEPSAGAQGTPT
eukprot:11792394-Alexandrium_andersonii.AAC.1